MKQNKWTSEQVKFLKDNYGKMPIAEIAIILDRSIDSLRGAVTRYEMTSPAMWSSEDDSFVQKNYGVSTHREIAQHLGRTERSVQLRIHAMGLARTKTNKNWSSDEIKFLNENIEIMSYGDLSVRLGRTVAAIARKAHDLGLTKGIHRGRVLKLEQQMFIVANCHKMTDQVLATKYDVSIDAITDVRKKYNIVKTPVRTDFSFIESQVKEMLDTLEIRYKHHAKLDRFKVDFLIGNKIIEVYGDYYHCNPYVYPDGPKDENQIRYIINDYYKMCYLLSRGYSVLYIWEKNLNEDPHLIRKQIVDFCRPELKNSGE